MSVTPVPNTSSLRGSDGWAIRTENAGWTEGEGLIHLLIVGHVPDACQSTGFQVHHVGEHGSGPDPRGAFHLPL